MNQARSLPTDKLRIVFVSVNAVVYIIQVYYVSIILVLGKSFYSLYDVTVLVFLPININLASGLYLGIHLDR